MNTPDILNFLTTIDCNNNRDWFTQHKDWYLQCHADYERFVAEWLSKVAVIDPELSNLQAKDCIWRIYRDLRFEKNRLRPYKEWMGAWLAPHGGRKSDYAGYYFHLQPGQSMFAAGMWCPFPALLQNLRRDIYENVEEVEAFFDNPEFKQYFNDFDNAEDDLKTAPAGYPRDWEHIHWLRHKHFTISHHFTDEEVCQPEFVDKLLHLCELAKPLNDFLNYTLEEMK